VGTVSVIGVNVNAVPSGVSPLIPGTATVQVSGVNVSAFPAGAVTAVPGVAVVNVIGVDVDAAVLNPHMDDEGPVLRPRDIDYIARTWNQHPQTRSRIYRRAEDIPRILNPVEGTRHRIWRNNA